MSCFNRFNGWNAVNMFPVRLVCVKLIFPQISCSWKDEMEFPLRNVVCNPVWNVTMSFNDLIPLQTVTIFLMIKSKHE